MESEDEHAILPNVAGLPPPASVVRRNSLRNQVEELGVAKGKRTLTLKRTRGILETPLKYEENTSVLAAPEPQFSNDGRPVGTAAEGRHNLLEFLLEVVSEASGDGEDYCANVGQHYGALKTPESRYDQEEEMTSGSYGTFERKLLARDVCTEDINVLKGSTRPSEEENSLLNANKGKWIEEAMDKKTDHDGIISADEKKYSRRGVEENKISTYTGHGKRVDEEARETRVIKNGIKKCEESVLDIVPGKKVSKGDEDNVSFKEDDDYDENSWTERSDVSDFEGKKTHPVKGMSSTSTAASKSSQELKSFVKKSKVTTKDLSAGGTVFMPAKPTSVGPSSLRKKRLALWVGTKPFVPAGPSNLPSPTVVHRRVVGLSRRHRPPPLHPYLLGS